MTDLHLSNNPLLLQCITCLTYLHWSQLQTLHLANVNLSAVGFLSLRHACWPFLQILNVTNNDLLVSLYDHYTRVPNLDMQPPLPMPGSEYWKTYLMAFCKGFWPNLRCLDI